MLSSKRLLLSLRKPPKTIREATTRTESRKDTIDVCIGLAISDEDVVSLVGETRICEPIDQPFDLCRFLVVVIAVVGVVIPIPHAGATSAGNIEEVVARPAQANVERLRLVVVTAMVDVVEPFQLLVGEAVIETYEQLRFDRDELTLTAVEFGDLRENAKGIDMILEVELRIATDRHPTMRVPALLLARVRLLRAGEVGAVEVEVLRTV